MRFSRYLDIRAFRRELADLKLKHGTITDRELERLERDRILIPSLRIRYPDSVERRWFKKGHPRLRMKGHVERNGPRWRAASLGDGLMQSCGSRKKTVGTTSIFYAATIVVGKLATTSMRKWSVGRSCSRIYAEIDFGSLIPS